MNKLSKFVLALVAMLSVSMLAYAGEQANGQSMPQAVNDYITIDDKKIKINQVIWDFTNVAFSSSLWFGNNLEPWQIVDAVRETINRKKNDQANGNWLIELREKSSFNKSGVINKWARPISIGIGWPSYQTEYLNKRLDLKRDAPHMEAIKIAVKEVLEDIRSATRMPIELYELGDERENSPNFSRIRILPYKRTLLKNNYKFLSSQPKGAWLHNDNLDALSSLIGPVPFTPNSRTQVDGFYLVDKNNNIDFAACRILSGLPSHMLRALIEECIVRSLGLPELSKLKAHGLLGPWNASQDAKSLIPTIEGREAIDVWGKGEQKIEDVEESDGNAVSRLNQMDLEMIRLLYCPAIKPGMDKLSVISVLSERTDCLYRRGL